MWCGEILVIYTALTSIQDFKRKTKKYSKYKSTKSGFFVLNVNITLFRVLRRNV